MTFNERIVYLAPRILGVLAICFISIFALDAFQEELSLWEQIRDFLMHLIPSFILALLLFLSWKKELAGGIVFLLIGLIFTPIIFRHNYQMNGSVWMSLGIIAMITFPFILIGILFIIGHKFKKKREQKAKNEGLS